MNAKELEEVNHAFVLVRDNEHTFDMASQIVRFEARQQAKKKYRELMKEEYNK